MSDFIYVCDKTDIFNFVSDNTERTMLTNAYNAISQTESWDFVSSDIESFSFSDDNRLHKISSMMIKLGYDGHSGISFGWTMRSMQYIGRNGLEKFKSLYDESLK